MSDQRSGWSASGSEPHREAGAGASSRFGLEIPAGSHQRIRNAGIPAHIRGPGLPGDDPQRQPPAPAFAPSTTWNAPPLLHPPQPSPRPRFVHPPQPTQPPPQPPTPPAIAFGGGPPGWPARIVLWSSILVAHLPGTVILPLILTGERLNLLSLYSAMSIIAGVLSIIGAVGAFLLTRNTSWAKRLIGAGIYAVAGTLAIIVPPLLTRLMVMMMYDFGPGMWTYSLIVAVFSIAITAAMLIGWNVARNRRWWVHLMAAGLAVLFGTFSTTVQLLFNISGVPPVLATISTQLLALVLMYGSLILLHACGRMNGGSVPSEG